MKKPKEPKSKERYIGVPLVLNREYQWKIKISAIVVSVVMLISVIITGSFLLKLLFGLVLMISSVSVALLFTVLTVEDERGISELDKMVAMSNRWRIFIFKSSNEYDILKENDEHEFEKFGEKTLQADDYRAKELERHHSSEEEPKGDVQHAGAPAIQGDVKKRGLLSRRKEVL